MPSWKKVNGYGYIKVRSLSVGVNTNVDFDTITIVTPEPTGHVAVTNTYIATGGRDSESDEDFRARIKSHNNIQARETLSYLKEVIREFNQDILIVQNLGINSEGQLEIALTQQNGVDLTQLELEELLDNIKSYFSLTDLNRQGNVINIVLLNSEWDVFDIDIRVQLFENYNSDSVRKNIQANISTYLDIRNWTVNKTVQWDDILQIVKDTEGIKYVPDQYFSPNSDIEIQPNSFPRIRGFIMIDLDGVIISSNNLGDLSPIFYPEQ